MFPIQATPGRPRTCAKRTSLSGSSNASLPILQNGFMWSVIGAFLWNILSRTSFPHDHLKETFLKTEARFLKTAGPKCGAQVSEPRFTVWQSEHTFVSNTPVKLSEFQALRLLKFIFKYLPSELLNIVFHGNSASS